MGTRTLQAPIEVAFDYTRSTGPVIGHFLTGLRDGQVVGARTADGLVRVPPPEFDPTTHVATADFVEVGSEGTVVSWTWVPEPVKAQPLDRPFAWALVRLDGADTSFMHAVDVASADDIRTGMRVRIRWAPERVGAITDIACFEPAEGPSGTSNTPDSDVHEARLGDNVSDDVSMVITPVSLDYVYAASPEESAFFRGMAQGRILGQRCPVCHKVYVPPRGACPVDGVPTTDEVELAGTGTVTTFCIVNVPFLGQRITPPYVSAYVLLDGADIAFLHLIQGIEADQVRMGMRVEAVWKPRDEWGTTIENILHFQPNGEPDAAYETYEGHL